MESSDPIEAAAAVLWQKTQAGPWPPTEGSMYTPEWRVAMAALTRETVSDVITAYLQERADADMPMDLKERAYLAGMQAAWRGIVQQGLRYLDPKETAAGWETLERAATVAALRELCGTHGDNDWPDDLYLADVIDKHLARYLSG